MSNRGGRAAWGAIVATLLSLVLGAAPVAAATAVVYRHGDQTLKNVALTFDDGYNASRSLGIASILDRYGVMGTFLPYASAVRYSPEAWRSIARRYPIANHTVSHTNLKRLTAAQVYREIDGARRIIENITNRRMVRIFRPPYGAYNTTVLTQSYAAGFRKVAMWNVDSGDALGLTDEKVYQRAIAGGRGAIVLMHAGPKVTVRVLPRVIESYRSRGYRLITLAEMLGVAWNRTPISGSVLVASSDEPVRLPADVTGDQPPRRSVPRRAFFYPV